MTKAGTRASVEAILVFIYPLGDLSVRSAFLILELQTHKDIAYEN